MTSLAECIEQIRINPEEISARLDLADCLHRRKKMLATWMRMSLAQDQAFAPLGSTFPTLSVCSTVRGSSYVCRHNDDPEQSLKRWEQICPAYWQTPAHCRIGTYFGRWIFSCWATNSPSNREQTDELGSMLWLEDLWSDGLLEIIEFNLGRAESTGPLFAWPEAIRNLPFFLNAARAFDPNFSTELTRQLFSWPSLIGLYLTTGRFPKAVVADLPSITPKLQFLSVESENRSRELDSIISGLPDLPDLRLVALWGPSISRENIADVVKCHRLSALAMNSRHLTRDDLFILADMKRLKWLGVNSGAITRRDLIEFRRSFPHIELYLSIDMLNRLGPA